MEEDYRKNFKSSEKNNFSDGLDPLCLYVRQIPVEFTYDLFTSLMSRNGRRATEIMLNRRYPMHSKFTYGFAHFATHNEARNALKELNGTPPLYLEVSFAKRKNEDDHRQANFKAENLHFPSTVPSIGRGLRIVLEGSRSVSQNIKVTTVGRGRTVTVASLSPTKKPVHVTSGQFSDVNSTPKHAENNKLCNPPVTSPKCETKKIECSMALVPNPFNCCFCCGKAGRFSCRHCKKPYCSKECRNADLQNHQQFCKEAKFVAERLLNLFKNTLTANDSSYVSDTNSDTGPKSYEECKPVENLNTSVGDVLNVSIVNIESPSKFWIQLKKYYEDFIRMERELTAFQKSTPLSCIAPKLHCCTLWNKKMCRAEVLKIKSENEVLINMFDYGKTVIVQKNALYSLHKDFRKLPIQAICCKLVHGTVEENIQWNSEDIDSFKLHTSNTNYKAHIVRCCNELYEVSLTNEDGIHLYAILAEGKTGPHTSELDAPDIESPPSIWSKMKPGSKMHLLPAFVNEDSIWCYLSFDRESAVVETLEIEKLLQNYSGKDITSYAEEGEFAAGFSKEYKQFYRCIILKRKCNSFLVRYIDYGNEEEITRLSSLSQQLYKKFCYTVKCEKPPAATFDDFQKALGVSGTEVTILQVDSTSAKFSFHFGKEYSIVCHPCYSDIENAVTDIEAPLITTSNMSSILKPQITSQPTVDHKEIAKRILIPKLLSPTKKYAVKVLFINTVSDVYVLLMEDQNKMNEMVMSLNNFCKSENATHVPSIGEVVSCKFYDNVWYRGQVLEKMKDKYNVFFVDYGNYDSVLENDVQILPEKFICPQFSVCVALSGIKSEEVSQNLLKKLVEENWDMTIIDDKKSPVDVMLFQGDCSLTEMIKSKTSKSNKSALQFQKLPEEANVKICFMDDKYLYVHQLKDLKSLKEMSKKLNDLSKSTAPKKPVINNVYSGLFVDDGVWYRVSIEEETTSNEYKVFFIDFGNYGNIAADDLRELPNDLFALPVYGIPALVEDRENLSLSIEKEYTLRVTGQQGDIQKVRFLQKSIDNSLNSTVSEGDSNIKNKSSLIFRKLPTEENTAQIKSNIAKSKRELKYKELPTEVATDIKICFEDKNCLYLHQVKDLKSLEEFLVKLRSLSDSATVKIPVINNVYCGLCNDDGMWYRVVVEEEVSSNVFKVIFIDYGNSENVSCNDLRYLPSELFEIPVFSIPVVVQNREKLSLNDLEQYTVQVTGMQGVHQKVKFLSLPDISMMKKQILNDGLNDVTACYTDGNILHCQLLSDSECLEGMFSALQQCGREGKVPSSISVGSVVCAQCSDNQWYRACVISNKKAPLYNVLFFDYGNTEDITGDCIKILPDEMLKIPVLSIPMKIDNMDKIKDIDTNSLSVKKIGVLDDGKVNLVEVQIPENAILPKISSFKKETLPTNCVSSVTICHMENNIYYVHSASSIDNLAKLNNQLLKADTFNSLSQSPEASDIICAKFNDGLWYRCVVKEVQSDKIKVCFVDYGNVDFVNVENIKVLPLEMCTYPVLCVPLKFNDEAALLSKISEEITTFDVNVCSVVNDIQVVSIVPEANASNNSVTKDLLPVSSHDPVFVSSFNKSTLTLKQMCNVIFKKQVDDSYAVLKFDDNPAMEKLSFLLQESETDFISHSPSVDEVLLAKGTDNKWYRCCVEAVSSDKVTCKVYFLDVGSTEDVQKNALRCLPESCKSYPLFAIKVSIESAEPVVLGKHYNIYVLKQNPNDTYCIKVYHQYLISSMSCKELPPKTECNVVFCHKEGGKLFLQDVSDADVVAEVESALLECSSGSSIPYKPVVGELVCAMSQLYNLWYRGCIEEVLSVNSYKVCFIDYGNCENVQQEHLQPIPLTLVKIAPLCVPVKFASNEIMENIELQKMYSVIAELKASDNVQIIKFTETEKMENSKEVVINKENIHKISKKFTFTSCESVPFDAGEQDIVIYSVDETGVFCAPYNTENIQANINLPELLTEHCKSKGIRFDDCEPELDEMVIALFPEDGNWYRATVIEKSHPTYDVNFVDYGNTEHLDISSLRKMEEQFMELQVQAHMCSLTGFTVPDENSESVCHELKKFTVFSDPKPLRAHIQIIDDDITANIPKITEWLVGKNLVTAT